MICRFDYFHLPTALVRINKMTRPFEHEIPDWLIPKRDELIAHVEEAFKDVSRKNGVSWSESEVIDDYGGDQARLEARKLDQDYHWSELVDDPEWDPERGVGGFSFLDAIGFRYYLAPSLVRSLRSGFDQGICFHLTLGDLREHKLEQWSALTHQQSMTVKAFLEFMIEMNECRGDRLKAGYWREAYDSHWARID